MSEVKGISLAKAAYKKRAKLNLPQKIYLQLKNKYDEQKVTLLKAEGQVVLLLYSVMTGVASAGKRAREMTEKVQIKKGLCCTYLL